MLNMPNYSFRLSLCFLCLSIILVGCSQFTLATPTSLPTVAPVVGWHKLNNEGFEIWLPESFMGGTNLEVDRVLQDSKTLGPDFVQAMETLKPRATSIIVFALDQNKGASNMITNMVIVKETVQESFPMESYVNSFADNLSDQYRIVQKELLSTSRYPTGRLVAELRTPQVTITQVAYFVKNGASVWQIVFSTPADELEKRLPVFNEIITTVTTPYSADANSSSGIIMLIGFILMVGGGLLNEWNKRRKKIKQGPAIPAQP